MASKVLWGSTRSENTIKHWFADCKSGRRETNDSEHSGRSNEVFTTENNKKNSQNHFE